MNYYPTVFIGFGPSGELALWHIKRRFLERNENKLQPSHVRFLWIGMNHCSEELFHDSLCERLNINEQLHLSPDYSQLTSLMRTSQELNLSWWRGKNRLHHEERDDARIAYVYETRIQQNPFLDNFLQQCMREMLHDEADQRYRVYLVGAIDEMESGFLFDFANDLNQKTDRIRFLVPWLFVHGLGDDRTDVCEDRQKSFMRELTLMMNSQGKIIDEFDRGNPVFQNRQLFDNIFLFDDIKSIDDVACQAVGFLEDSIAVEVNSIFSHPTSSVQISTIRSASIQVPITQLSRLCAIHFVQDCFYQSGKGITVPGVFQVEESTIPSSQLENEIEDFLDGGWALQGRLTVGYNPAPFRVFSQVFHNAKITLDNEFLLGIDLIRNFNQGIRAFLNQYENLHYQQNLGKYLSWQLQFLEELRQYFADVRSKIQSQRKYKQNKALKELGEQIPQLLDVIDQLQKEIREFRRTITESLRKQFRKLYQYENELFKQNHSIQSAILQPLVQDLAETLLVNFYQTQENPFATFLEKVRFVWHIKSVDGKMAIDWELADNQIERRDTEKVIEALVSIAERYGIADVIEDLSVVTLLDQLSDQQKYNLVASPELSSGLDTGSNTDFERRFMMKSPLLHAETIQKWVNAAGVSPFSNHLTFSDDNAQLLFLEVISGLDILQVQPFASLRSLNEKNHRLTLTALQNAVAAEDEIRNLTKLSMLYIGPTEDTFPKNVEFSALFSRFFNYPDRLELAAWYYLYQKLGPVRLKNGSKEFCVVLNSKEYILLSQPPTILPADTILKAFEAFVFRLPISATFSNHPLHRNHCEGVYHRMEQILSSMKEQKQLTLEEPSVQSKLDRLDQNNGQDADFYHDLSIYLKFIIRRQEFIHQGILQS